MADVKTSAPVGRKIKDDKNRVQVIARAAMILRSLEEEPGGLSLSQIAQRVGLARSTVQRIVAALETEKFLIGLSPNGRVALGPALVRLASSVSFDLADIVRPLLTKLSLELKETVDLAIVKTDHLVFVDQVVGSHRLRTVSAVGERFPLHCTANGKAYLATLDDRLLEPLLGLKFEARTPKTIISLAALKKELAIIRQTGIAFDREEHTLGICAAGIALRHPLGSHFAISIPVPTSRFEEAETEIESRLLETRRELEILFNASAH